MRSPAADQDEVLSSTSDEATVSGTHRSLLKHRNRTTSLESGKRYEEISHQSPRADGRQEDGEPPVSETRVQTMRSATVSMSEWPGEPAWTERWPRRRTTLCWPHGCRHTTWQLTS